MSSVQYYEELREMQAEASASFCFPKRWYIQLRGL